MADNPRYQTSGIMYADMPNIQFASLTEDIKASQSLQSSLDKITEYAYKGAAEKAKTEGMQYGVNNTPSLEQIMLAMENKKPIENLFNNQGGIYGKAAREAQATQLRTELESQARTELASVKEAMNLGPFNMEEVSTKLNGIVNGYSKILAKIDAEQSMKFRASIGSSGSEVMAHGIKITRENLYADQLVNIDGYRKAFTSELNLLLENNDNPLDVALKIGPAESNYIRMTDGLSAPDKIKEREKIIKLKENTIVDHISNYVINNKDFFTDPYDAIQKIQRGIVGDKTDLYGTLGLDSDGKSLKVRVMDQIRKGFNDLDSTRKEVQSAQTDKDKVRVAELESSYYKKADPKILVELNQISIRNPNAITPKQVEEIKKSEEGEAQYSDPVVRLKNEAANGKFDTLEGMYVRAKELGVSRKAANVYVSDMITSKTAAFVEQRIEEFARTNYRQGETDAGKANKQRAARTEVDRIVLANQEHNDKVGKVEKPVNKLDVVEMLMQKKEEKRKANVANNTNIDAFNNYAKQRNLDIVYPTDRMDEKTYELFKNNIKRRKLSPAIEKDIMLYLDAIEKSENDLANLQVR
jgi:hypothetical protein